MKIFIIIFFLIFLHGTGYALSENSAESKFAIEKNTQVSSVNENNSIRCMLCPPKYVKISRANVFLRAMSDASLTLACLIGVFTLAKNVKTEYKRSRVLLKNTRILTSSALAGGCLASSIFLLNLAYKNANKLYNSMNEFIDGYALEK